MQQSIEHHFSEACVVLYFSISRINVQSSLRAGSLSVLFARVSWRRKSASEAARRIWRGKVIASTIFTTTNLLTAKILARITH